MFSSSPGTGDQRVAPTSSLRRHAHPYVDTNPLLSLFTMLRSDCLKRARTPSSRGSESKIESAQTSPIAGTTPAALGARGNPHAHATFGIHAPFGCLYAVHSVNGCAVARDSGVSAGVRYRGRSVGCVCIADGSWHPRPHPNAPLGAAQLSDLGPSAVSARRDPAGDAPVLLRR